MIFWKTNELADKLRANTLPETEKLKYFLLGLVFVELLFVAYSVWPSELSASHELISGLARLILLVVGLLAVFKSNSAGDNLHFMERVVCLSWPLSVKLLLLGLVVAIPLNFRPQSKVADVMVEVSILMLGGVFYWRLNFWIRRVSHSSH